MTKQSRWSAHVQPWQSSGASQAGYRRAHGLSLASFGYWRRKLAGEVEPASTAVLPIRVAPAVQETGVEVGLPDGIVLRVAAVVGTHGLGRLLDPHAWLTDTLARLPSTLDRDIDTLLPLRKNRVKRQGVVGGRLRMD